MLTAAGTYGGAPCLKGEKKEKGTCTEGDAGGGGGPAAAVG